MKRVFLIVASCFAFVLSSCNENNEGAGSKQVSRQAKEALVAKYPGASNVAWEAKGSYLVAHFSLAVGRSVAAGVDCAAWFDNDGGWYMTETDIAFDQLPLAVSSAFAASEYASWRVDDVDMLEREGAETVYVIEAEGTSDGKQTEVDRYYSADGVLIKTIVDADDDYEDYIPSVPPAGVESYIETNYPGARILEIDQENGTTEVEILDGRICRELLFGSDGSWIYTKTEMRYTDVPEAVKQALAASEYASYRVDEVDFYQRADGDRYRIDLESASGDIEVEITPEGVLSVVTPDEENPEGNSPVLDEAVIRFIANKYPGARILESDNDEGLLEVEIYHDTREKTVYFDGSNGWLRTQWDVRRQELPEAVARAIAESQYASYRIDDIEYVQNPSSEYYRIELEHGDDEVSLNIHADGVIN